jgi:hypothetical protein
VSAGPMVRAATASAPMTPSLGSAPTQGSRAPALASWNPPASTGYLRAPAADGTGYAPATSTPTAHIPALARRLTIGSLRLIPLVIAYIVLPNLAIQQLQGYGVVSGIPSATLFGFGILLAALSTAAYVARPSGAYGPLATLSSVAKVVYLVYLSGFAWVAIAVSNVGVQLQFGNLLLLLAVVPAFGVVAGIVTTVEDARHPGERLPFDYPA